MTLPSRDFLIRQATLNVLWKRRPFSIMTNGVQKAAEKLMDSMELHANFILEEVRKEYKILLAKHSHQ